ncbi:reverse transcriptase domain-containing protein [Tanacetum coccineum]
MHPSYNPSYIHTINATTRHNKGKEIAKPVTPQSESVSEEDSDPEQARRDKDMQKNLALLAKYFKKLHKPTNNNLRTSSNSRNKTEDTTPRYNNDNQSRQFGNQRTVTVAGDRETVGSPVVQKTGIQCFNCKGFGHYARECRKPKRVKKDTDEEIDEQELEAHYSYMAKIQEVSPEESSSTGQPLEQVQNHDESNVYDNVRRHSEQPESINNTYVLEKDDSNVTPDSSNICTNDNQVITMLAECVDERVRLLHLTLDTVKWTLSDLSASDVVCSSSTLLTHTASVDESPSTFRRRQYTRAYVQLPVDTHWKYSDKFPTTMLFRQIYDGFPRDTVVSCHCFQLNSDGPEISDQDSATDMFHQQICQKTAVSDGFSTETAVSDGFPTKNSRRYRPAIVVAPFLNVQKTFDRSRSSLVLHQMTSDHNRSELGIQDHSNEQSSSKLVPKVVP